MSKFNILAINPGSTSSKIAVFANNEVIFEENISHSNEELERYDCIIDQLEFRKNVIKNVLDKNNIELKNMDAIVGRGGLLKPIQGGTYEVNDIMLKDLQIGIQGQHASNLGGIIANEIANEIDVKSYIVDPVVVDELDDVARLSGNPLIERRSIFHALNQKAIARRASKDLDIKYEESNFIVVHMGGGISVGAHKEGKVIEVANALDGEGPFSPERSGGVPIGDLVKLCFSNKYTYDEVNKMIKGSGGLVAYLGTNDMRKVESMIMEGNKEAEYVFKSMAYQISKEIGACLIALKGDVDAIVLTGGIAHSKRFTDEIKEYVGFISNVMIYPGEDEMLALAEGANRVLNKEEHAREYL